jgi:signal transduction histidine kinase
VEAMQRNGKLLVRVHPARDWHSGIEGYKIVVADSGPGIPKEHRKKLFDPFYTTKGQEGTGLGLWITFQLVHKHGGSIHYRSRCDSPEQKGGTVFSVWLPLVNEYPILEVGSPVVQAPISRMAS